MAMRVKIQKWGNSVAVRLPALALEEAGFKVGQKLDLRVEGHTMVLEPAAERLEDLLDRMTPDRRHRLALDEPSAGNEEAM